MDAFSTILVSEGVISAEQLAEAVRIATSSGKKVQDEVVRLGYATGDKVMKALAKAYRMMSSEPSFKPLRTPLS